MSEIRENVIARYQKLFAGICVGITAATGRDISEIPGVLELVSGDFLEEMSVNPQKFIQKFKIKENQFSQLK